MKKMGRVQALCGALVLGVALAGSPGQAQDDFEDFEAFEDEQSQAFDSAPSVSDSFGTELDELAPPVGADAQIPPNTVPIIEEPNIEVSEPSFEPQNDIPIYDSSTPVVASMDAPDLMLESKFYQIYQNYHSSPTPETQWNALLGGRSQEYYQIRNGDTLWGVSETLFGDGNYWPKIWSQNGEIKNPHLISPSNRIQFFLGSQDEAPSFVFTESTKVDPTKDISTQTAQVAESTEETVLFDGVKVDIPPPTRPERRVIREFPPSLPDWQNSDRGGNYDTQTGIELRFGTNTTPSDRVPLETYIVDRPDRPLGTVREMEAGGERAALYQYLYVTLPSKTAKVGDRFLVVQNRGLLTPPLKQLEDQLEEQGYQIQVQGEIEIVELNDSRSGKDLFRALVVSSINPILVDSWVVPGKMEYVDIDDSGQKADVNSVIVGGYLDSARKLFTIRDFVFLNRGEKDGLIVGQRLDVRATRGLRVKDTLVKRDLRNIGELKIVKLSSSFATAVVTKVSEEIRAGDVTGSKAAIVFEDDEELSSRFKEESLDKAFAEFDDIDDAGFEDTDEGFEEIDVDGDITENEESEELSQDAELDSEFAEELDAAFDEGFTDEAGAEGFGEDDADLFEDEFE